MEQFTILSNQMRMPSIGLGTYDLKKEAAFDVVLKAIQLGYRHLETAPIYLNEAMIGQAIKASKIDRDQLFITSKIPPHIKTYDGTIRVVKRTLKKLDVDYLDAVLINNPVPWGDEGKDYNKENVQVYKALEALYKEEIIAAIGVSNFSVSDLKQLIPFVEIPPHINQLGLFIGHTLNDLRAYCNHHKIMIQAHSPLARGRLLNQPYLIDAALLLNKTPAQVALNYVLKKGAYPIVKASTSAHLKENLELDFEMPDTLISRFDSIENDVRDYKPPKAKKIL